MSGKGWLNWVPLLGALILPFTFSITYVWSVVQGHVEPDFPYISLTGTYPPESCFFGLMLNISAILIGFTIFVRHRAIVDHCNTTVTSNHVPKRSRIASYFGYAGAIGICIVANFQATNVPSVHIIGAFLAFGVGNIYLWIQSWLSFSLEPRMNSRYVTVLRLFASATATAMNITTVVFSFLHSLGCDEVLYWDAGELREEEERCRWGMYLAATSSEWVLAAAFVVFLVTYVPEFKRVNFQVQIEVDRDRRQARDSEMHVDAYSVETVSQDVRL